VKLLFDHQAFCEQVYGGISRYFVALIGEYRRHESVSVRLPFSWVRNAHLLQSGYAEVRDPFWGLEFRGKPRILDAVNKIRMRRALRAGEFDVLHATYYDDYFVSDLGSKPAVATVHDLIPQRLPQYFPSLGKHERNKKAVSEHAARIIAVSESTRRDLIALFGTAPERVTAIPLAASSLQPCDRFPFPVPDRYVLYVGKRDVYKNFARFSEAMAIVLDNDSGLHLFCAGGGRLQDRETAAMRRHVAAGRVHWRPVDDSVLAALYRNADAFVFPSLYEGFGIPILESMQMGCPAIVSGRSSFPEVADEAAVYFDPDDAESIADAVQRVLKDRALRQRLRDLGFKRERRFSWRKTAEQTLGVYQQLI
jgi:glycosyltransferase involved in cell wall biosynthesis